MVWPAVAAFLLIQASHRVIVDAQGVTTVKLTRGRVLIPWDQIKKVRVRGDSSANWGSYRTAKFGGGGGKRASITVNSITLGRFTELLIVLKCYLDARNGCLPVDEATAEKVSVAPAYWDYVIMPEGLRWSDTHEVAVALHEAFPCVDPNFVTEKALQAWITSLRGFEKNRKQNVDVTMISGIRQEWLSLYRKHYPYARNVLSSLRVSNHQGC